MQLPKVLCGTPGVLLDGHLTLQAQRKRLRLRSECRTHLHEHNIRHVSLHAYSRHRSGGHHCHMHFYQRRHCSNDIAVPQRSSSRTACASMVRGSAASCMRYGVLCNRHEYQDCTPVTSIWQCGWAGIMVWLAQVDQGWTICKD